MTTAFQFFGFFLFAEQNQMLFKDYLKGIKKKNRLLPYKKNKKVSLFFGRTKPNGWKIKIFDKEKIIDFGLY